MNVLLRCEDLGVVEKTLELLLIPARKIDSQKSLSDKFDNLIDYRVVEVLAGCTLPPLAQPAANENVELQYAYFHARRQEALLSTLEFDKESIEYCRLLAMAIYLFMSSDVPSDVTGFSLNPSLIADTAKLITAHPTSRGQRIEAAALSAVRGFLKFDSKWTETVYALDASASHGPVATILRTISHCIIEGKGKMSQFKIPPSNFLVIDIPYETVFLTAFFDLTTSMANTAEFDEALVTSTIIDEIVRAFPTTQPRFYKTVEKFMGVLDPLIQYMTEALDAFFAADGLGVAVKHVYALIEIDEADEAARKPHLSYLASLLKFLLKLLNEFGSNDRLRNLIEGSLFKSIKSIFEAQSRFGPEVFYYATHILSTFIHTEPTSLAILQESGVPQSLLTALTSAPIPAHAELLTILPQAFDAICLNSTGASAFIEADPLPAFLTFLTSSSYFAQLQINHSAISKAMAIGNAMDEFMRHHPNLLSIIIPNLIEAVDQVKVLLRNERGSVESDAPIQQVPVDAPEVIESVSFAAIQANEQRRRVDPLHISMLESLFLFIEAIIKTPAHREAFMAQSGVSKLLACYCAPLLPADFVTSQACLGINQSFHMLAEEDAEKVITSIIAAIASAEETIRPFLTWSSSESIFLKPLTTASPDWNDAACLVQELNVFGTLVALLADLSFSQSMNFSRSGSKIVPTILQVSQIEEIMTFIGKLVRSCLWQYWSLRRGLPREWLASACRFSQVPQLKQLKDSETIPVPAEIRVLTGIVDSKDLTFGHPDDIRIKNLKSCLSILHQIPTSVIAFFTGLARTLAARRVVSTVIAELSPEDVAKGFGLIVRSFDELEFVTTQPIQDAYLMNRLISASVSLKNIIFIDDSNFKPTILMPALNEFDLRDGFVRLLSCLEHVFAERIEVSDQFLMISINDVFESVLGVFSRVADESMYRPTVWEDSTRPGLIVKMFDFMAQWTCRVIESLPTTLPHLSIECIQLLLSTWSSLMLTPNPIQSGMTSVLEEVLRCARSGQENKHIPEGFECVYIKKAFALLQNDFISLIPSLLQKSTDLSFDIAQLLARLPELGVDFAGVISLLMSSNVQLHSKLLAIVFASSRRITAFNMVSATLEQSFLNPLLAAIESAQAEEKHALIASFGLVAANYISLADAIDVFNADLATSMSSKLLRLLRIEGLSVNAVHALLLATFAATRSSFLMPEFGKALVEQHKLIPVLLKHSTRCLDSDDVRQRSIVSLVALILRHLVESPTYLTALFRQEMTARFRAQKGETLEDLYPFSEAFFLRDRSTALSAVASTFTVDLMEEATQRAQENNNESWSTYTLKSQLRTYFSQRLVNLKQKQAKLEELKVEHEKVDIELPTDGKKFMKLRFDYLFFLENPAVIDILKDETNSPFAAGLIDCIVEELLTCSEIRWPASVEELKAFDAETSIQQAHYYRCVLMLFLSELILAYPICHRSFLSHPKATKLLEFAFQVMTPYGNVRFSTMNQAYERSWVQYLLINICMGSIAEEASISVRQLSIDRLPQSMADSCKFVVGCLMTQLRSECRLIATSRADELLIGRFYGLSDTIFCLLTIKTATVGRFAQSMTAHLAALLLENRAVHFLSQALQAFDSNNPAYEDITVNIIRALEALCKFSNKLSKLAARASSVAANPTAITDFSMLQDFSSTSDSETDYGYESLSDNSDNDGLSSGVVSDEMDTSDEDMLSDFDLEDDDMSDGDSGYTSSSDFSSDEDDGNDLDLLDEAEQALEMGDLSGVRGRNMNMVNNGPFDLIVEEIDVEDDSTDADEDDNGFPVGSDEESSSREYDFDHHAHHHHHGESDFDSEDDMDGHDDDSDHSADMMNDDDWDNEEDEHEVDGRLFFGSGMNMNSDDANDFPMIIGRGGNQHHRHRTGRGSRGIEALIGGMIAGNSFAGQARSVSDAAGHPFTARPTIEPNADPLRAHLPLLMSGVVTTSNRPTSIVFSQGRPVSLSTSEAANNSASKAFVNAEPFHFPQAVATNRRWQQDIKFAFGDLVFTLGKVSKAQDLVEEAVKAATEPYRELAKRIDAEDAKLSALLGSSVQDESKNEMIRKAFLEVINNAGLIGDTTNSTNTTNATDTVVATSSQPDSSSVVDSTIPSAANTPPPTFVDEGVDVEFLTALPVDLREEALMTHFDERRRLNPDGRTQITVSQAFLDRLPADLRNLYLQLSESEIRDAAMDMDMGIDGDDDEDFDDAEGFDLEFDDGEFIAENAELLSRSSRSRSGRSQSRPHSVLSEAARMGQVIRQLNLAMNSVLPNGQSAVTGSTEASPSIPMKILTPTALQAISAVDPSSLVSMLRSYYSPVISERRLHHKLFLSLCRNNKTLVELINLLIYVLERMPSDLVSLGVVLDGYVETLTGAPPALQAGKAVKRSRSGNSPGTATPPLLRSQTPLSANHASAATKTHIPVLQRTLQLLLHLSSHNESVCAFFTAPVEKPWTIKRHAKLPLTGSSSSLSGLSSQQKTTMTISTCYPIVLIMACLERSAFVSSSLLVEYLMHLLQVITGPLAKVVNPEDLKSKFVNDGMSLCLTLFLVEIPHFLLAGLVRTLVGSEFTPKAFTYASHLFQNLAVLGRIAGPLLSDLSEAADVCLPEVVSALRGFQSIESLKSNPQLLKNFSLSTAAPARLLRLIRVVSALSIAKPSGDALLGASDEPSKVLAAANLEIASKVAERLQAWSNLDASIAATLKHFEGESLNGNNATTAAIQEGSELLQVALLLLPVIEAFFLRHRLLDVLQPQQRANEAAPMTSFAEEHRIVINSLIRTKPTLLTAGTFLPLTRVPKVLDFDNKRLYFRQQLHRKRPDNLPCSGTLNITVRREHVFEDSFTSLQGKSGEEVKWSRLVIKFSGEEGVDAGGVTREWFSVLARQMFNPDYALFRTSAADRITYQPNRMSYINPDHLLYFHFIGRVIGKAVFDGRLLDCYFTRSFYKHILRLPVALEDLEAVDLELYKSLCWIADNDISGVMDDLTFTTEADEFGTIRSVELKPDGASIAVNESNKREYIRLLTEFKLTTAIAPQIDAFLRGFTEIIPASLIGVFTEQEFELLISGMPDIDVDDWRAHCDYHGGYTLASPQIQWFWRAVRSFDSETRAKLIQFVTGTSKVPLEGFANLQGSDGIQKFQIHRDPRTRDRLPTAHTCFNQLDLPEYETYEELCQQLLLSINEGETGFGFI